MARAAAALALALALAPSARADTGSPTQAVREVLSAVNKLLDDPGLRKSPVELRAAIRGVLVPSFDARETARLTLGSGWQARSPAERDEFAWLLANHLERAYVSRIATHVPLYRSLAVRYLAESIDGGTATVGTAIVHREGGEFPVEYRLIQRDDRWKIFDVTIDGSSFVENYRALFARVMREGSYADVVALLKARMSEAPPAPPRAAARGGPPATSVTPAPPLPDAPATASTDVLRALHDVLAAKASAAANPSAAPVGAAETSAGRAPSTTDTSGRASAVTAVPVEGAASPGAGPMAPGPLDADQVPAPTRAKEVAAASAPTGTSGGRGGDPSQVSDPQAAPKPPAASPTPAYWLQVGVFKDPAAASQLASRLRAHDLPVSVDSVKSSEADPATMLSRVRVGPFAERAAAAAKLKDLQTIGYRPFLAVEAR